MIIKLQHATISHARLSYDEQGNQHNKPVDADGYYFEIQAEGNYETLATSEVYSSKAAALEAIGLIEDGVSEIRDLTEES